MDKHVSAIVDLPPELMLSSKLVLGKYPLSIFKTKVSAKMLVVSSVHLFNSRSGIFLGLIWGRISALSQLRKKQKLPKMVYIIPDFLVLHFGENFIKSEQN